MKIDIYYAVRYLGPNDNTDHYKRNCFAQFVDDSVIIFRRSISLPSHPVEGQYYCFKTDPVFGTKREEEEPGKLVEVSGYLEDKGGKGKPFFLVSENWLFSDWVTTETRDLQSASRAEQEIRWGEHISEQKHYLKEVFGKNGWEIAFDSAAKEKD